MDETPPLIDADLMARLLAATSAAPPPPDQETIALRRLIRETGAPAALATRLWRELAGEQGRRAGAPPVAVYGGRSASPILSLAQARFGVSRRYGVLDKAEAALAAAAAPQGVAVLSLAPADPWWLRLLAMPELKIFAALPDFGAIGPRQTFAVAALETGPTGGDETYFATDAPGSAAAVIRALQDSGLIAELVQETGGLKLLALAGYVQPQDDRLAQAPGRLKGVIGAAPTPLDF